MIYIKVGTGKFTVHVNRVMTVLPFVYFSFINWHVSGTLLEDLCAPMYCSYWIHGFRVSPFFLLYHLQPTYLSVTE
ncbi:RNA polymerase II-associated protein 1-like protein [Bienertia sinuspersici]